MGLAGPTVSLHPHGWPINDTIYADRQANAIYLIYAPRVTKHMLPDYALSEQTKSTETHSENCFKLLKISVHIGDMPVYKCINY